MQFLNRGHRSTGMHSPDITLTFDTTEQRDGAMAELLAVIRASTGTPLSESTAHAVDILSTIHRVSTSAGLDHREALGHLQFIAGLSHGLINLLGGKPPPIPPAFFAVRLGVPADDTGRGTPA